MLIWPFARLINQTVVRFYRKRLENPIGSRATPSLPRTDETEGARMTHRRTRPREEAAMLDFAARWSRHGGGSSEDIFVTFGLAPRQYFLRLRALLAQPSADIAPAERAAMAAECQQRLAAEEHPYLQTRSTPQGRAMARDLTGTPSRPSARPNRVHRAEPSDTPQRNSNVI